MKPLSKLHQEAIIKAQNATDQNKAAAMAMIEKPIEMIKAIMLKHELAVIEVMRELHESREAAVRAEREACAKVCEERQEVFQKYYTKGLAAMCAEAIRARSKCERGDAGTKISEEISCKTHPDAPHGFDRNMSHTLDRYVCECEYWEPSESLEHSK